MQLKIVHLNCTLVMMECLSIVESMCFSIYSCFIAFLQISTNAQTQLTIVMTMQPVPISMVHLIVLAILVTWAMVHFAKVINF